MAGMFTTRRRLALGAALLACAALALPLGSPHTVAKKARVR
jgi:hypothetical protein